MFKTERLKLEGEIKLCMQVCGQKEWDYTHGDEGGGGEI